MIDTITSEAGLIATGIGLFIAINALFFKADDYFSKEFKDDVALWILCLEPRLYSNSWSIYFTVLFDKVFSKNNLNRENGLHVRDFLNIRTFSRSCIASILSILTISLVYFTVGPGNLEVMTRDNVFLILVSVTIILNLIPDYFSLLQTRYILKLIQKNKNYYSLIGYLLIDILLTTFIFFFVGLFLGLNILELLLKGEISGFQGIEHLFRSWGEVIWLENGEDSLLGVFLFSTFFTSVWLWLFGVSNLIISFLNKTQFTVSFLKYALPIEERPFRSIGIVSGIVSVVVYWFFAITSNIA